MIKGCRFWDLFILHSFGFIFPTMQKADFITTVDFCVDLIQNSDLPRGQLRKYLHYLLSLPENFEVFCRLLMPDAFTKPFAQFHKDIFTLFNSPGNSAVGAPRGHGKSTEIGLGFVLWNIAYEKVNYLVYISANYTKSVEFLSPLTSTIKHNKLYKFIYGDRGTTSVKDEDSGKDKENCFDIGKQRIQALSFESNIRGMKFHSQRPDLIILDDIESDERTINPILRAKDQDKLNKQIIPALDFETGRYKMVGTILHHDCLLVKKIQTLSGKIFRACEIDEDGTIDPNTILFPEMFTVELLMEKKRDMGSSAFSSEYLNNPIDDSKSVIKRKWVQSCYDENLSFDDDYSKYDSKFLGVDFAFSDRVTADKSAFLALGINQSYKDIIGCLTRKGMSILEQFDMIEYTHGTDDYTDVAMEENSIRSMSAELNRYNFPYTLFWTAAADEKTRKPEQQYDPEYQGKRHTVGKTPMIKRMATRFENSYESHRTGNDRQIRIPYQTEKDKLIAHTICDECCTYALQDGKLIEVGPHGDIPIALCLAFERADQEYTGFQFGFA